MILYEVANIINGRPIGIVTGTDPTCPMAITPNHLILERSTSEIPQGQLDGDMNVNRRYQFLQRLVEDWWKQWYQSVLPCFVQGSDRNVQKIFPGFPRVSIQITISFSQSGAANGYFFP